MKLNIKITKCHDVKTPDKASRWEAGVDFYVPTITEQYLDDLFKVNQQVTTFFEPSYITNLKETMLLKQCVILEKGMQLLVPTGIHMSIPNGWYLQLSEKSGMSVKKKLRTFCGVIDSTYRGQVMALIEYQGKNDTLYLPTGSKFIQGVLHEVPEVEFELVDTLDETCRQDGAFGSTQTCRQVESVVPTPNNASTMHVDTITDLHAQWCKIREQQLLNVKRGLGGITN